MTAIGQLCLLIALVSSGYAAFACMAGTWARHSGVVRSGFWAASASVFVLTATVVLLAWALVTKDFCFQYVALYSDATLPWHYSLAGFWVGQAGSILLWSWFVAMLAVVYRVVAGHRTHHAPRDGVHHAERDEYDMREFAFGTQMAYLCFLIAIMVFAADPMQPSLSVRANGDGLSPSLQHPAMLVHPPIVFLGYATWGIPFALALAALMTGRLDDHWVRQARPWALAAWAILGGGILWGAEWAYEELGWGGYWSWDPVENGSLIPWLTGTALVHGLMTWKQPGVFKKTTLLLAIITFALCNFATFLIRSGVLSSLHAFSQSPIGWMFLAWIFVFPAVAVVLVVMRRSSLAPEKPLVSLWSRESLILIGTVALVLLALAALLGTLAAPLSGLFSTTEIVVGPAFYNKVLIPTALVLLLAMAAIPLLRWSAPPTASQTKTLALAIGAGSLVALAIGLRRPMELAIGGLAGSLAAATLLALLSDCRAWRSERWWLRPLLALSRNRRKYAGYLIHLSFALVAIGVAGSSLGSREDDVTIRHGETISWAGRSVHFAGLVQTDLPDKVVLEAQLEVQDGKASFTLLPAQLLHRTQNQWSSQVAIHSTWKGDFYAILHGGTVQDRITLTLIENPLIRWLWLGGCMAAAGAAIAAWPTRTRRKAIGMRDSSILPSKPIDCQRKEAA